MLRKKIYITGEINEEAYEKFSRRLTILERQNPKSTTIEIELFSGGGDARSAIAISGRMRKSHLKFKIYAYGYVASAAVLILASGDYRILAKDATVMVHEDSFEFEDSYTTTQLEKLAKQARIDENHWSHLMAEHTTKAAPYWLLLHKHESYLPPDDCLLYGLVEEVI